MLEQSFGIGNMAALLSWAPAGAAAALARHWRRRWRGSRCPPCFSLAYLVLIGVWWSSGRPAASARLRRGRGPVRLRRPARRRLVPIISPSAPLVGAWRSCARASARRPLLACPGAAARPRLHCSGPIGYLHRPGAAPRLGLAGVSGRPGPPGAVGSAVSGSPSPAASRLLVAARYSYSSPCCRPASPVSWTRHPRRRERLGEAAEVRGFPGAVRLQPFLVQCRWRAMPSAARSPGARWY